VEPSTLDLVSQIAEAALRQLRMFASRFDTPPVCKTVAREVEICMRRVDPREGGRQVEC